MTKFESKQMKRNITFVSLLIIGILIFWHPWINQQGVNDAFEEMYGSEISEVFEVRLTEWNPFGYSFEVRAKGPLNTLIGYGLVNLFGDVTEFTYVWES